MKSQREAIIEFAERCNYDTAHCHQVEALAGTLFIAMEPLHHLKREDRKLLEFASILHDIGYSINSQGHHRFSLQLILMEPLPEFSRNEKVLIANIARYHRKALPSLEHTPFNLLSDEDKQRVGLLAPLLRIADALDRSHMQVVTDLSCEIEEASVMLNVGCDVDFSVEIAAMQRKADMFQHVYRKEIQMCLIESTQSMEGAQSGALELVI